MSHTWKEGHVSLSITMAPTPAAPPAQALALTAGAVVARLAACWQSHSRLNCFSDGQAPTLTAKRRAGTLSSKPSHSTGAAGATWIWKEGLEFDVAYTSELQRAQQTLRLVMEITGQDDLTVHKSWRLNERMYGALQGLNKKETVQKYGDEQVLQWRRSFTTPPPPCELDSEYYPGNDNKYIHVPEADIPRSECLKDTIDRTLPYWETAIVPALKRGKTVLIAAHGNSIRGMVKALDGIADDDIVGLEIPTGVPLLYELDADLKPLKDPRSFGMLSGAFLGDPEEIAAAQKKVADQTKVEATNESDAEGEARLLEEAKGV